MEKLIHRKFSIIPTICIFCILLRQSLYYKRESILSQAGKTLFQANLRGRIRKFTIYYRPITARKTNLNVLMSAGRYQDPQRSNTLRGRSFRQICRVRESQFSELLDLLVKRHYRQ